MMDTDGASVPCPTLLSEADDACRRAQPLAVSRLSGTRPGLSRCLHHCHGHYTSVAPSPPHVCPRRQRADFSLFALDRNPRPRAAHTACSLIAANSPGCAAAPSPHSHSHSPVWLTRHADAHVSWVRCGHAHARTRPGLVPWYACPYLALSLPIPSFYNCHCYCAFPPPPVLPN